MKPSEHDLVQSLRLPRRRPASAAPSCLDCPVRQQCVPGAFDDQDCGVIDRLVERRVFLPRGEHLYWMDQAVAQKLYAIRVGQFKIYQLSTQGAQRVASFQAEGDILGLDTIGKPDQRCSAVALTNSVLCEFSYPRLAHANLRSADILPQLDRLLSRALVREQWRALLVREGRADQKLAGFLLAQALHHGAPGQMRRQLHLAMTRQDIGDYLGMMAETVSRLLHQFERAGFLAIHRRMVDIVDPQALRRLADGPA
ncbi:Crp/Fnr family transcriptional regulator [Duganella caerulea]|uniref:helix-turn-helix domain-containing protein n=1 Tax=Duganella caerulea TaxID=2885762 RepID=UPI0030E77276